LTKKRIAAAVDSRKALSYDLYLVERKQNRFAEGVMGLTGFREYMQEQKPKSVFADLAANGTMAVLHLCSTCDRVGTVVANDVYGLTFRPVSEEDATAPEQEIAKHEILLVYSPQDRPSVRKQLKGTAAAAEPLKRSGVRNHIKNKTLFPLMKERVVVSITLLDGVTLRGLVAGFNRYEIQMHIKDGTPVTILRHGVLTAQTKAGRSLLKRDQDSLKDWKKSPLYENTDTKDTVK
jgi:sRNA-binding regulator protein Hfq